MGLQIDLTKTCPELASGVKKKQSNNQPQSGITISDEVTKQSNNQQSETIIRHRRRKNHFKTVPFAPNHGCTSTANLPAFTIGSPLANFSASSFEATE